MVDIRADIFLRKKNIFFEKKCSVAVSVKLNDYEFLFFIMIYLNSEASKINFMKVARTLVTRLSGSSGTALAIFENS
jgi:hypothetical protein